MVFTHSRGFVIGESFGLQCLSFRWSVLVCHAADTASLAMWFLFGKLFGVAIHVGFGEKRCPKNLPLGVPRLLVFRIEQDDGDDRESFGPYTYRIYGGDQLIARFWHDFRGDDHEIDLLVGTKRDWPFARFTEFIGGRGPEPLQITERGVSYLQSYLAGHRDA